MINSEKIFSEHREGKRGELAFDVLFIHEKDFNILLNNMLVRLSYDKRKKKQRQIGAGNTTYSRFIP